MEDIREQEVVLSEVPEETLNQATHGVGFALSVVGAYHLLTHTPIDGYLSAGCWIYAVALVALFAASTLSHSYISGPLRTRYRTLDQLAIFTVMAATYTPMSLVACRDGWWNLPLVSMWLMAGLGMYLKIRVTREEMVPVWFYMVLGLIPLVAFPRIFQHIGATGAYWILTGGCCYLLGVIFLTNDRRVRYFHSVWHVLVIMGSVCHYIAITSYAMQRV
jgi:hemolysin III